MIKCICYLLMIIPMLYGFNKLMVYIKFFAMVYADDIKYKRSKKHE